MIILGKSCYFKFNVNQLNVDEDISIWMSNPSNYEYRVNGGLWNVDSTSGTLATFGIRNNQFYIKKKDDTFINFTNNETIEIWCENVYSLTPTDYELTENYKLLNKLSISQPIYIDLCNFTCERSKVGKGTHLTNHYVLYGQFTEEFDILNPSLLIQYDGIFEFNYVSIPILNRNYYITKITNVRKDLWRIDCHVDVLYTYGQDERSGDLYKQSAYIERNEINPYNIIIADDRYTFANKPVFTYADKTGGTLSNITFSLNDNTEPHIVMSVLNNETITYNNITAPTGSNLNNIDALVVNNNIMYNYAMDGTNWNLTAREIASQQTLASFITGAWSYPFSLRNFVPNPVVYQNMKIGTTTLSNGKGTKVNYDTLPYLIIADFVMDSYNDFTDIEPYKTSELYIPFVNGMVTINRQKCCEHRILVYYSVQLSSGQSTAYVYDVDTKQVLYTAPCQLAQQLPIETTNNYEINLQRILTLSNYVGKGMDAIFKMVMGGASENILGAFGGGQQLFGSLWNGSIAFAGLQDTANVQIASANSGFFNPLKVYLCTKSVLSIVNDTQEFYHKNGYPIHCWDVLNLSGYEYTGYTELSELHYTPVSQTWITTTEINEIETLARDGIIL